MSFASRFSRFDPRNRVGLALHHFEHFHTAIDRPQKHRGGGGIEPRPANLVRVVDEHLNRDIRFAAAEGGLGVRLDLQPVAAKLLEGDLPHRVGLIGKAIGARALRLADASSSRRVWNRDSRRSHTRQRLECAFHRRLNVARCWRLRAAIATTGSSSFALVLSTSVLQIAISSSRFSFISLVRRFGSMMTSTLIAWP